MEQKDFEARAGEVMSLLDRIRGIRRQTRWLRLGFALLILVTIVAWFAAIWRHFQRFDVEKFSEELLKRAEKTWPIIADELGKLVEGVLPTVEASLLRELESAGSQISERFEAEAEALQKNVSRAIEESLREQLTQKNRAEAIEIVKAAFPDYKDPEKVDQLVASLHDSFMKSTQKRLLTMLAEYYDTLREFEKTFNKIKADIPEGQRPATLEGVLELWLELVYEKMGGDSELEATKTKPSRRSR